MTLLGSEHSILIRSKFKSVLQLRLQQRRTREQLAEQGIMPPLKSPAAFHEQRKSLERSKTGDYLKHKIRSRPEKSELVNMRILQVNHGKLAQQEDLYAFEEDSSSESLSPDQLHSEESQCSAEALTENKSSPALTNTDHGSQSKDGSSQNQEENMMNSQETPPIPVPAIVKQSKMSEKNRHKKPKDIKPKVKKLKYHQYIPPDQKAEKSPAPQMDSAYACLLQQQQLFLQLQILSQQKPHPQQQSFSYQTLSQNTTHKPSGEQQSSCASSVQSSSSSSSPVKSSSCNPSISPLRTGPLPADLDDLKVSELRQQLRMRGLAVSGTKTALIERLRPFRDSSCASPAAFPVTPTGSLSSCHFYRFCSSGSTPPISPASSELSVSSFSDATVSSPQFGLSADEGPDPEKDKMLVEKQKVIEELRWKLQQEQRQVEELRLQLHKRKRMQDCPAPPQHMTHLQQFYSVSVKQEQMKGGCMAHCDLLELHSSGSPAGLSALLSPQCSPEDPPVTKPSSSPPSPDSHTLLQNASRATRSTQLQQKSCSYPPDQRNLPTLYHQSPSETSVSARGSTRAKSAGRQQNQMSRSQQMDELLDVLIESGEMPANAKEERSPVTKVVPHLTVSPKFHRHYSQVSPSMLWSDHGDAHLEPLLSRTQGDAALLKMPAEDGFTKISAGAAEGHGLGMTFAESPWETMEWLDLIPPSSANASHSGLPPSGPSIFNTELLDETDISLHLEHCFVSSGM
ncbi:myocardin-like [Sinocyclocheilus grahami]|uniref:myocardin-like n=1 Tax=Sinocyclocheilus grahami TaxID=75366 RepID=UPI0007ACD52A|nr:PREDICTED: myocardin-like [Sinocyclocheilus grahami]